MVHGKIGGEGFSFNIFRVDVMEMSCEWGSLTKIALLFADPISICW